MIVFRQLQMSVQETREFKIGDQIVVGEYTATCQKITKEGALFLLDQYLDDAMPMNYEGTNIGGYESSHLRKELNHPIILDIFSFIREKMIPFENGDLLRIPYVEEFFGIDHNYESSEKKQWELMRNRKNRIATRKGTTYEWGWLQNKVNFSSTHFAYVCHCGYAFYCCASLALSVRPVFLLKLS